MVNSTLIIFWYLNYRNFSIKRPRRLFQTWHGAFVSLNKQLIWARHFLRKDYYSFFLAAVYLALDLSLLCNK